MRPLASRLSRWTLTLLVGFAAAWAAPVQAQWVDVATVSSTMGNNAGRLCVGGGKTDVGCPAAAPFLDTAGGLLTVPGDLRIIGNLYVSGSQQFDGVTFSNGGVSATGTVTATSFTGSGAGLSDIPASAIVGLSTDRIISGSQAGVIANATGYISLTTGGITGTAYFTPVGNLIVPGISTTAMISAVDINVSYLSIQNDDPNGTTMEIANKSTGGKAWYLSVTGASHGNGPGAFSFFNGTDNNSPMLISDTGLALAGSKILSWGSNANWAGLGTDTGIGRSANGIIEINNGRANNLRDLRLRTLYTSTSAFIGSTSATPSSTLHVSGTLRIANGGESCDTNRIGAIKYENNAFYVCQNTVNGWEAIATTGENSLADRITSNSMAGVIANANGYISLTTGGVTGTLYFTPGAVMVGGGVSTTGSISATAAYAGRLQLGLPGSFTNAVSPFSSYANIVGDYAGISGMEIRNTNNGINAESRLLISDERGSSGPYIAFGMPSSNNNVSFFGTPRNQLATLFVNGPSNSARALAIGTLKANPLIFGVSNTEAMRILSTGNVGIGTSNPQTALHVSGTLRIANGAEACDTSRLGAIRYATGSFDICRNTSSGWEPLATATSATDIAINTGLSGSIVFRDEYGYLKARNDFSISSTTGSIGIGAGAPGWLGANGAYVSGSVFGLRYYVGDSNGLRWGAGNSQITGDGTNANYLAFTTSNTEALRIVSNGFVGIGVTTPSATLHLSDSGNVTGSTGGGLVVGSSNQKNLVIGSDSIAARSNGAYSALSLNAYSTSNIYLGSMGAKVSIGMQTRTPSTTLDVSGTLRIANGGESCDTDRLGAIRYGSGSFDICRSTSNGWEPIATATSATDIAINTGLSGSLVFRDELGKLKARGDLSISATTGSVGIGAGAPAWTGNNALYVQGQIATASGVTLGDAYTLSWGGTRTKITGDGTSSNYIAFTTSNTEAMRIASTGYVGIGTLNPSGTLHLITSNSAPFAIGNAATVSRYTSYMNGNGTFNTVTPGSSLNQFGISSVYSFGTANTSNILLVDGPTGAVGIRGITTPSTSLHVSGTLRIANGGESCDTDRTGAIKYESGQFQICRNGTSWETLVAGSSGTVQADRITSGTTSVITYNNTSATIATNGTERLIVGTNGNVGIAQQPLTGIALAISGSTSISGRLGILTPNGSNVYVGNFAGSSATGSDNTGLGFSALQTTTGSSNVAVGKYAGQNTTGSNVVAVGNNAALANDGSNVTAIGSNAAMSNSATSVVAVGTNAAQYAGAGSTYSAFIGNDAGQFNTGTRVAAIGPGAAQRNSGDNLTAMGAYAGQWNTAIDTTALGYNTAQFNSGARLTAVGQLAASKNSADNVTAIGYNAVSAVSNSFSNITGLGYDAQPTKSNQIMLGNTAIDEVYTYGAGIFGKFIRPGSAATGSLPSATTAGAGAIMYDSTAGILKYSDGTAWSPFGAGAGGIYTDRITSGTTQMITYNNTSATIATNGIERFIVGTNGNIGIGQQPIANMALSTSGTSYFNGNVGIGRTAPTAALEVSGTISGTILQLASVSGSTGVSLSNPGDNLGNHTATQDLDMGGHNITNIGAIAGLQTDRITSGTTSVITYNNASATIATAGVERVVVGTNGNVGIGVQPNGNALNISGTLAANALNIRTFTPTATGLVVSNSVGNFALGMAAVDTDWSSIALAGDTVLRTITTGDNIILSAQNTGGNIIFATGASDTEKMRIASNGSIGIGTTAPSTTLHVSGTLRIASGGEACDADRLGAIKYESNNFQVCRNGTTWETLVAGASGTADTDRITSGTTSVITYNNTSATIATNGTERLIVGTNGQIGIAQQPESSYSLAISGSTSIVGLLNLSAMDSNGDASLLIIGSSAGTGNTGTGVIAVGNSAASSNAGSNVIAFGNSAADSNTADDITAIGRWAAAANSGSNLTALGNSAALFNIGDNVIAVGDRTADNNTGSNVTAVGNSAASYNTADYLTALGQGSAGANGGTNVLAIGMFAAESNQGGYVTALGDFAAYTNYASGTTAVGYSALRTNQNGLANTAVGYQSLYWNADGSYNTTLGYAAGLGNNGFDFSANTLLGSYTGIALTTGSSNTIVGANSGMTLTTGSNNILIGAGITPLAATGSNQLSIGNAIFGDIGNPLAAKIGINVTSPTANFEVSGTASFTSLLVNGQPVTGGGSADRITSGTTSVIARNNGPVTISATALHIGSYDEYGGPDSIYIGLGTGLSPISYTTAVGGGAASNNTGSNVTAIGNNTASGNTGNYLTVIGENAANSNTGDFLTSFGNSAASNNTGSHVTAIGEATANTNTGNNVTAIGNNTAGLNTGSNVTAVGHYTANNNTGDSVTALGVAATYANTGNNVTGIGYSAASNNAGSNVTAIGGDAANNNTGDNVTALGESAAEYNTGNYVTAIGDGAAFNNTASYVVAVGRNAAIDNTASGTTAVGYMSLNTLQSGLANTAVGYNGLKWITAGSYNTALGYAAGLGNENDDFSANTLLGAYTGTALTTGSSNTIVGTNSGMTLTTGSNNILIGAGVTPLAATGSNQLSIGNAIFGDIGNPLATKIGINVTSPTANFEVSGTASFTSLLVNGQPVTGGAATTDRITSGTTGVITYNNSRTSIYTNNTERLVVNNDGEVGIGQQPLSGHAFSVTGLTSIRKSSSNNSIFIGEGAGFFTNGTYNVAIGLGALQNTAQAYNIAIGNGAGQGSSGGYTTFIGNAAGAYNTASYVVALGHNAGRSNQGGFSTMVGADAGYQNQASGTTAVGNSALNMNTTGLANTAIGYTSTQFNETGSYNTTIGYAAGLGVSGNSFSANTLLGSYAGTALTTGSSNTIVGTNSGMTLTTGSNNILIGAGVTPLAATGSNQLSIGNAIFGDIGRPLAANIGINVTSPTANFEVSGTASFTSLLVNGQPVSAGAGTFASLTDVSYSIPGKNILGPGSVTSGGTYLTAYGVSSLASNTTGTNNAAYGSNALARNTTGGYNTAVGVGTMSGNTTGNNRTAIGHNSLSVQGNQGDGDTAVGVNAMRNGSRGNSVAIGMGAMYYGSGGTGNVAVGAFSLNAIYSSNTVAIGNYAAYGQDNTGLNQVQNSTIIGAYAGRQLWMTSSNTLIGYNAGAGITSGNNNLVMGTDTSPYSNTGSNQLNIANAIWGNIGSGINNINLIGINVASPTTALHVSGTLRIANGAEACDADRTGAIRFTGGQFQVCRNGTSWETLVAGASGTADTDRITSGTTSVIAYNNTSVTITTSGTQRLIVGTNGNIGIGITSPSTRLEVSGTISGTTVATPVLDLAGVAGSAGISMTAGSGGGGTAGPADRISTTGVSSGSGLAMVVAGNGSVSFTLGGTAGAAYLHPTLGLVAAGVSTTGTVSGTTVATPVLDLIGVAGSAGISMTAGGGTGTAGPADRISTTGVTSGAGLGMVVASAGTISFTLGGTAGAAYLHPTLGLVAPGVSTTGTISGTVLSAPVLKLTGIAGSAGISMTAGADNLGNHTATQAINMAGFDITGAAVVSASGTIKTTAAVQPGNTDTTCSTAADYGKMRFDSTTGKAFLCRP